MLWQEQYWYPPRVTQNKLVSQMQNALIVFYDSP